ncbi:rhomboid domain-containing protein 2 [Scophthalmus maximus]|nr:rhomboid domain-containing protein 2 [Scophthalmus maximus]
METMTGTGYFKMLSQVLKDALPVITCGGFTVVLLSCVLFGVQTYFSLTPGLLGVGAVVFQSGHIHRLFVYPLCHTTFAQLLLNAAALLFLGGSLERGIGTVRFLLVFLLLSSGTGLCYSLLELLLLLLLQGDGDGGGQRRAEGLVPAALACVALTTAHSKMTRGFLCGLSFPTVALPWVLLVVATAFVPHCVLPCNIVAVLIGWLYGRGWFSLLHVSEARAAVVEKTPPFRWMRSVCGGTFVPASAEERRKTLLPEINPTPGSYPVQAYAPLSSVNAADASMYEGWPNSTGTPPLHPHAHGSTHSPGPRHGHSSCNHHHHHAHSHG